VPKWTLFPIEDLEESAKSRAGATVLAPPCRGPKIGHGDVAGALPVGLGALEVRNVNHERGRRLGRPQRGWGVGTRHPHLAGSSGRFFEERAFLMIFRRSSAGS
jgi:hypothetical protein